MRKGVNRKVKSDTPHPGYKRGLYSCLTPQVGEELSKSTNHTPEVPIHLNSNGTAKIYDDGRAKRQLLVETRRK